MRAQCLTMMPPAGRPMPQGRCHQGHCQPVKTFARKHHACLPLMVMVLAHSPSPPQHNHQKRPNASRSTTSALTTINQPLWPYHHGNTRLTMLTRKEKPPANHSQAMARTRPAIARLRPAPPVNHGLASTSHGQPHSGHSQNHHG
jgi:hypothetical protein